MTFFGHASLWCAEVHFKCRITQTPLEQEFTELQYLNFKEKMCQGKKRKKKCLSLLRHNLPRLKSSIRRSDLGQLFTAEELELYVRTRLNTEQPPEVATTHKTLWFWKAAWRLESFLASPAEDG